MKIQTNVLLKPRTTFNLGGRADFFCSVKTLDDLRSAWNFSLLHHLPRVVIGGGSNLLIADQGIRGIVICLANDFYQVQGTDVVAGAGLALDQLVEKTISERLRGLESLSGIPGTVAGAVYGNAGAWGKSIGDLVSWVRYFDGESLREISQDQCGFGYRTSVFKAMTDSIIWQAGLALEPGELAPLKNLRQAILAYRAVRYPLKTKSAGSFFKNVSLMSFSEEIRQSLPPSAFSGKEVSAGYLIEQVQCLGKRVGQIQVCPHQGNFFINRGRGTSQEVIELARIVQQKVEECFGVFLEPEVKCLGFSSNPLAEKEISE